MRRMIQQWWGKDEKTHERVPGFMLVHNMDTTTKTLCGRIVGEFNSEPPLENVSDCQWEDRHGRKGRRAEFARLCRPCGRAYMKRNK